MAAALADEDLLRASREDVEAFAIFYRRHSKAVLAYVHRRVGDIETAAELTADVFAEAFASRHRYQSSRGPGRAWLFGIANHRMAMSFRKQARGRAARERLGVERIAFEDADLVAAERELCADRSLARLVDGLPPSERDAVIAHVIEERSYADIANATSANEAAIRQRVSRGLARLAVSFGREP